MSIALIVAIMNSTQVRAAAITFGLTGTLLVWFVAVLVIRYADDSEVKRDSIRFNVKAPMVPEGDGALFWVRYKSFAGDTLSPMPVAIDASITNTRSVPVTIDDISVEFREDNAGWIRFRRWQKLQHVPTLGGRIYFIYDNIKAAALLDLSGNGIDQLLEGKSLMPNIPVQGWLFFEKPNSFSGTEGTTIQWRFKTHDTAGNEYEAMSAPELIKKTVTTPSDVEPNSPFLKFTGVREDLSTLAIRRWHDPVP